MKATALQHEQYQSLVNLGINRKTAIRMLARQAARLIKSESKKMEKSKKLETLIATARSNPAKLTEGTRNALNNYLQKNNQPLVATPTPESRFRASRMSTQEYQQYRMQQALEAQKREAEEAAKPITGMTASWL